MQRPSEKPNRARFKLGNQVGSGSNHQVYSIIEKEGGNDFTFTTTLGVTYLVYFTEADGYVSSASFASEAKMLGFVPLKETYTTGKAIPNDPDVWIGIFEIAYLYMTTHPKRVLFYVCSDESVWRPGPDHKHVRYAKKRSELFAARFDEWQQTGVMAAEHIPFKLYEIAYCGCLMRQDNPYRKEVRAVIAQTEIEKQ